MDTPTQQETPAQELFRLLTERAARWEEYKAAYRTDPHGPVTALGEELERLEDQIRPAREAINAELDRRYGVYLIAHCKAARSRNQHSARLWETCEAARQSWESLRREAGVPLGCRHVR